MAPATSHCLGCGCLRDCLSTRDKLPVLLFPDCGGPKVTYADTDMQGRMYLAGAALCRFIAIAADHLGAADCGSDGGSRLANIRRPIGQQRVAGEIKHFTAAT